MEERIRNLCDTAVAGRVFPGCVVAYIRDGQVHVVPAGHLTYEPASPKVTEQTVYDVASITKSIPTGCLVLHLIERGLLDLDDKVVDYIPELKAKGRHDILVRHLLSYTLIFDLPGLSEIARTHPERILEEIFAAPLKVPPGTTYSYHNTSALLMGLIVERITNVPLNEFADEVYGSLPMNHTSFSTGWMDQQTIAPTERDWRGDVRGVVHDEAAWALRQGGRVAGHAGLFSTAPDLMMFAQMLLNGGVYEGRRYFDAATVALMHTNQLGDLGGMAGLGWEMRPPLLPDGLGSDQVFGKTGFTGSVIVIDPVEQLAFCYVSNRTYPVRPKNRDAIREFRYELAKIIYAG